MAGNGQKWVCVRLAYLAVFQQLCDAGRMDSLLHQFQNFQMSLGFFVRKFPFSMYVCCQCHTFCTCPYCHLDFETTETRHDPNGMKPGVQVLENIDTLVADVLAPELLGWVRRVRGWLDPVVICDMSCFWKLPLIETDRLWTVATPTLSDSRALR